MGILETPTPASSTYLNICSFILVVLRAFTNLIIVSAKFSIMIVLSVPICHVMGMQ